MQLILYNFAIHGARIQGLHLFSEIEVPILMRGDVKSSRTQDQDPVRRIRVKKGEKWLNNEEEREDVKKDKRCAI